MPKNKELRGSRKFRSSVFKGIGIISSLFSFMLVSVLYLGGAAAQTYYVAPNGSDTNPGSIDYPWQTPQKAAATAVAGDIIYLRGGLYRIKQKTSTFVNFANSGASTLPIMMSTYPDDMVGGNMAVLSGMLDLSKPSLWTRQKGSIYYYRGALYGSDIDGTIALVVQNDVALKPQPSFGSLRGPGQVYFDNSQKHRLYVWAIGGGNPGSYHTEVSQCDRLFLFDASDHYIVLDNLTITGAYYGIQCFSGGGNRSFQNLALRHFKEDAIKFNTGGNHDDLVEQCVFSSYGDFGIDTYGSSNQIFRYNEFRAAHTWGSGGAIKSLADGNHHVIDGNYIHDIKTNGWQGAIELREAEHIRVVNNLIVNSVSGINVYGDNSTLASPVPDPTSIDVEIVNNTIYRTTGSAIWVMAPSTDTTVQNNIVVQGSGNSYCLRVDSGGETGFYLARYKLCIGWVSIVNQSRFSFYFTRPALC